MKHLSLTVMVTYPFKNKSIPLYEIFIGGQLSPLTVHISIRRVVCTHALCNIACQTQVKIPSVLCKQELEKNGSFSQKFNLMYSFFFLLILVSLRDPKFEWSNKKKLVYFAYRLCGTCILNFMRYFLQNVNLFGRSLFGRSLYRLAE